jgi:VanZ family protein
VEVTVRLPSVSEAPARPLPRYFTYIVVGLIAYASLYPFDFHVSALLAALRGNGLQTVLTARSGFVDMVANVLFYMPLGIVWCSRRNTRSSVAILLLAYLLAGAALSTTFELLQFAVPGREPSIVDISLNAIGTLLGALAAIMLPGILPLLRGWHWLRTPQPDRTVYLILAGWLILKGAPFIPRLGLYKLWHSLHGLRAGQWSAAGALESLGHWLIVLTALRLAMKRQYFWPAARLMAGWTLLSLLLFRQHSFGLDDLLGAMPALGLIALLRRQRTEATFPALFRLTLLVIVVAGLSPFEFSASDKHFVWLPFGGTLDSKVSAAPFALLAKVLLYGGCLWAGMRSGLSALNATTAVLLVTSFVEAAQLLIPGRVAEITDPLLVIALGVVLTIPALAVRQPLRRTALAERRIER